MQKQPPLADKQDIDKKSICVILEVRRYYRSCFKLAYEVRIACEIIEKGLKNSSFTDILGTYLLRDQIR